MRRNRPTVSDAIDQDRAGRGGFFKSAEIFREPLVAICGALALGMIASIAVSITGAAIAPDDEDLADIYRQIAGRVRECP